MAAKVEVNCPVCATGAQVTVATGGEAWAWLNEHRQKTGHHTFWIGLPPVKAEE